MTEKIKLSGQLIDDKKPTVLVITKNFKDVMDTVAEYQEVYPDIFLTAEWGTFRTPISHAQKIAIGNLMHVLTSPLSNLLSSIR